jgi:hypothetical protein
MNDYKYTKTYKNAGSMTQSQIKDISMNSNQFTSISFIIDKENKVNDYKYLYNTKFRKELIDAVNICRTNPDYISSKLTYLKSMSMRELILKSELSQAADDLMMLVKLYNSDLADEHKSKTRSRLNKYGASYGNMNEIVIIGFSNIDSFIVNLLTHNRDTIINQDLNYIGLAIDFTLDNNLCIIINFAEHFFAQGDIIPANILKRYSIDKKYLTPQENTYKEAVLLNKSTANPGIRRTKSIKPEFSIKSDRITHFSTDYGRVEERHTTKLRKTQNDANINNNIAYSTKTHITNNSRPKCDEQSYYNEIKNIRIMETPDRNKGNLVKKIINYKDGTSETFIFKKD